MIELVGPFRVRVVIILESGYEFFKDRAFGKGYLSMVTVVRADDLDLVHSQVARVAAGVSGCGIDEAIFVVSLATTYVQSKKQWGLRIHVAANFNSNQYAWPRCHYYVRMPRWILT